MFDKNMRINTVILTMTRRVVRRILPARLLSYFLGLALIIPAPGYVTQASAAEEYRIGAGDLVNVVVAGRPDLTGKYSVGSDGLIVLPLVGGVDARGKT